MKIKEVTIHNYKSISQDCILDVNAKITPLVGASEAGKTNILEALNKFFASVAFDESDTCTFSEQPTSDDSYIVSVTFKMDDRDREGITVIDERLSQLSEFTIRKQRNGEYALGEPELVETEPRVPQPPVRITELHGIIRENLESVDAQLAEFYQSIPELTDEHRTARQTLDAWIEHMPLSGFAPKPSESEEQDFIVAAQNAAATFLTQIQPLPDIPPQLIDITNTLTSLINEATTLSYEDQSHQTSVRQLIEFCPRAVYINDADIQPLNDSISISELEADAEQSSIYHTLLKIAGLKVTDLRDTDVTRRERKFRNGVGKVNRFLKLWTQEKLDAGFVVSPDNLLFHITGKEGHFGKLSDRSEGFRWFLSFCLSYGAPVDSTHDSILLLDEPGLHLHASAQKDLLELFESVADSSQIIYTTHSPFMINKNYPDRIRSVFKNESPQGTTIDNKPYRPTKGGYYEPVRSSIGITLGNSLFIGGCNLIVEGISDQILITAFSRHLASQDQQPFINLQDICITPAGGANNVPYFAYLCNIENMKPVILLDNDREGENAFLRIQKEQVVSSATVVRVRDAVTKSKETIIDIEDLVDRDFYHAAFLEAYEKLNLDFVGALPKKYEVLLEELDNPKEQNIEKETGDRSNNIIEPTQKTTSKSTSAKRTGKPRMEQKGRTAMYSQLFEEHTDAQWGSFDKTLVARRISEKIEDGDVLDDDTLSNFKNLFTKINTKFKQSY